MNTIKYSAVNNLILALLTVAFSFAGCKKDDGPIKEEILSKLEDVPAISTNPDATGSQAISILNLASFNGKFSVTKYFPNSISPDKVDVVVRKSNSSGKTVKVFKADVSSFPASFTVTSADLTTLFGAIALNDNYDFSVDIYYKGKKYEAFPADGTIRGIGPGGPNNMPGFSEFVRFSVICGYDPDLYQGDFEVMQDDWADYSPGDIVTLTKIDATHFSFINVHAVSPVPIVLTVNPNTNLVSLPRVSVGSAWGWAVGTYTGAFMGTTGAASSSYVSPCDQTVTLSLLYGVDIGNWSGPYLLVLKKVN